nr:unnamed protein product [Callosobruchus chinensis]
MHLTAMNITKALLSRSVESPKPPYLPCFVSPQLLLPDDDMEKQVNDKKFVGIILRTKLAVLSIRVVALRFFIVGLSSLALLNLTWWRNCEIPFYLCDRDERRGQISEAKQKPEAANPGLTPRCQPDLQWRAERRNEVGTFYTLFEQLRQDDTKFFNYFRMSITSFDELHGRIKDNIQRRNTKIRNCIVASWFLNISRVLSDKTGLPSINAVIMKSSSMKRKALDTTKEELNQSRCRKIFLFDSAVTLKPHSFHKFGIDITTLYAIETICSSRVFLCYVLKYNEHCLFEQCHIQFLLIFPQIFSRSQYLSFLTFFF